MTPEGEEFSTRGADFLNPVGRVSGAMDVRKPRNEFETSDGPFSEPDPLEELDYNAVRYLEPFERRRVRGKFLDTIEEHFPQILQQFLAGSFQGKPSADMTFDYFHVENK